MHRFGGLNKKHHDVASITKYSLTNASNIFFWFIPDTCERAIGLDRNGVNTPPPYPDGPRLTIVELGSGAETHNLVSLARANPNSEVHGIEQNPFRANDLRRFIQSKFFDKSITDRISIHEGDFSHLQVASINNQADIVVAIAPDPQFPAKLYLGINNFAKIGGQVVILTEDTKLRDAMVQSFNQHNKTFTVTERSTYLISNRQLGVDLRVSTTSLGIALGSGVFHLRNSDTIWELYISSW